jgi:hypothetical protein
MNNRRDFIKKSALAGMGLSGFALKESHLLGQIADNEKEQNDNFIASQDPVDLNYMDINVKDIAGLNCLRPVTGGIPLAEGFVPEGSRFILLDKNNRSVPCQSQILTRWKVG